MFAFYCILDICLASFLTFYHSGDCTICKTKELPLSSWGLPKVVGFQLKFSEPTTYMASWPDSSTALFVRSNRGEGTLHHLLLKIWLPMVYDKMLWQYQQTLTQQTTYLFSQGLWKGAWERGRKCVFLLSFSLCTVNSLNPSNYHSTNT